MYCGHPIRCRYYRRRIAAQTCQQCHPFILGSFANFNPHVEYDNPQRDPVIYLVYTILMNVLIWTFAIFVVHCLIWFIRSMIDVLQNGRPKGLRAGAIAYVRFDRFHRITHLVLMAAFLILALSGLLIKYSLKDWARYSSYYLGGFESIRFWHRMAGLVVLAACWRI